MSWIVLILSGVLEAVWATALGKSEGFTKLWPSVVFGVALIVSMGGLAWAMRDIPVGTAQSRLLYAVRAMRAVLEADARPAQVAEGGRP